MNDDTKLLHPEFYLKKKGGGGGPITFSEKFVLAKGGPDPWIF